MRSSSNVLRTGRLLIWIGICLLTQTSLLAQDKLNPRGTFLKDSVKLGEEVGYVLTVTYPRGVNIVFPDSLFDFSPFEIYRKEEFNTVSDSLYSFDSVIYYLASFEIDQVQSLEIPVFQILDGDSLTFFPARDSVMLIELISELPDSVALKENSQYQEVELSFNYPYLIIGLVLVLVVVLIIIVIYGKQINNKIRIWRLNKQFERFLAQYNSLVSSSKHMKEDIEKILIHWKKYVEKLERIPYTKLTTKEIMGLNHREVLSDPLKSIDRALYAGQVEVSLDEEYNALRQYAQESLKRKINFIKNDR